MNSVVQIDLHAIERDLAKTEQQLARLRADTAATEAKHRSLIAVRDYLKANAAPVGLADMPSPTVTEQNGKSAPLSLGGLPTADAAERVLRDAGRPMRTVEIAAEMRRRGFSSEAEKLPNTVFSTLSRREEFKKIGRGLWGLAEWPNPGDLDLSGLLDVTTNRKEDRRA